MAVRRLPDEEHMNHVFVWEASRGVAVGYVCQNCGLVVSSSDVARVASEEECRRSTPARIDIPIVLGAEARTCLA